MKQKTKYITVNYTMGKESNTTKKSQKLPICEERLSALCNGRSQEAAAINDIIKNIAFLCGHDSFKLRSVEGVILGGEDE